MTSVHCSYFTFSFPLRYYYYYIITIKIKKEVLGLTQVHSGIPQCCEETLPHLRHLTLMMHLWPKFRCLDLG